MAIYTPQARSTREGTMNINDTSTPPSMAVSTTSPFWPLGPFPNRVDSHANSHPLPHQLQHPPQDPLQHPQAPFSQGSSQRQQQQQHPQWHPHPFPQSHRAFGPPPSAGSIITTNNLNRKYSNGNNNNLNGNSPGSGNLSSNVSVNRPPTANVQVRRRPHAATTAGRFRSATRVPDLPVLNNLRITSNTGNTNVDDSSSSDEGFSSPAARPQRPEHRRSMSHPFPSLFSSKKKKAYQMYAGDSGSETVDDAGYAPKLGTSRPSTQHSRNHRNVPSTGSKDYSTGNCMTCGCLVRWPKELSVFKCTICLTVNDLQPSSSGQGQGQGPRRDASRNSPPAAEERVFSHERPISLGHTKSLATQCLRSYLSSALRSKSGRQADVQPDSYFTLAKVPSQDQQESSLSSPSDPGRVPAATSRAVGVSPQPQRDGLTVPNTDLDPQQRSNRTPRSYSSSYPEKRPAIPDLVLQAPGPQASPQIANPEIDSRRIFKRLEDYIISCLTSYQCLNTSFSTTRPSHQPRPSGEPERRRRPTQSQPQPRPQPPPIPQPEARKNSVTTEQPFVELDAKMLLLGDFAENGLWWTGGHEEKVPGRSSSNRSDPGASAVSPRSPRIDWAEVEDWYTAVLDAVRSWPKFYDELVSEDSSLAVPPEALKEIEAQLLVGQDHVHRSLLRASETIMKRPGRLMTAPHELRFILILAANPLLHANYKPYTGEFRHMDSFWSTQGGPSSGRHSGIIKRIVGLLSNTPNECHNHLVNWFARYPEPLFIKTKDLISSFLAFRLNRQNEKKYDARVDITAGLIPSLNAGRSAASLHAALGSSQASGKKQKEKKKIYNEDWQIKASAQVLALIFAANNTGHSRRSLANLTDGPVASTRDRVQMRGQILATSDFYTTLLDDSDLVADFETWESKKGKFAFCQFPFLLSIGAKIQILEYDAKRQMEDKARDAFFNSILTHRVIQQHLVLDVRRDCLVDDSLKAVSEVIGSGGEDIKKGLKINFKGEEGIDAGGLRKEWFLLLVREVFNPDHGMFVYDEDSQYCYFNPASLEPSEQYFLVGVVFGLAIYNSTILDVALPPFAFRKLLMAAPPPTLATSQPRQPMTYSLDDLAEYRPRLASGLRQLLEYDGDVESTFCLDFVVDIERYGSTERVSLCPNGERRPVTNANRREYVDLYVRYLLDTAVTRQFEPFKRGFYTVCGGNALSLFRPEEIELLVRGSDESLDISALKSAATYDNWSTKNPVETEPTVGWFWELFEEASPADQRKLLLFITGSDRIPAGGAAALSIRIACLGEDCGRYPTARTCFNSLALWKYGSRERLKEVLWTAVLESEGFGLK
ncbi:hypothetical protein GE21DRAFT_3134 [Neurospora crassa]|uniref:HECT-type E3 ubiquitin transferase n=1 Tax=Neurospora crassa (strain ATCC 24698 / 74-OR23-1A / CBS 708.71 / DSM 1257 / FGSC 987) TaxID=367110 RepID=V5IPY7_NEUCR|nr:ubiquitin-protein ligase, variant [Neurospora crassa OR74A]ESA43584.1 ubiquitin-protein ligase, variant [Neurospora crassa OR74A]KHE87682.1 hypothetical protein GE21DRAFT_3134 [Neurospora crassa]|eukprot:XP_011393586.1 ubiquitin-protein ligase, variant [Neurospora crassa OR74A]